VSDADWLAFWGALIGLVLYLLGAVGALISLLLPFLGMDPL
jgi:hypothetical protein